MTLISKLYFHFKTSWAIAAFYPPPTLKKKMFLLNFIVLERWQCLDVGLDQECNVSMIWVWFHSTTNIQL